MNAVEKLEQIARLYDAKEVRRLQQEELIRSVTPVEVREKIDEINEEFMVSDTISPEIERLTQEVKDEVISTKQTVKGSVLMAVLSKGRVYWDDKMLMGYAASHPEILPFREEGSPSVSIRKVSK